ncbi:TonB-dependent receptor [Sphingobium sp. SCG-1]|uniref:TonB-dependent receptor n=1 Tax=Sphingobium sp. SCG-1 TaxID=2072936 RepID=UPI000CD67B7E|nr:TonB-dependent receptor [Sphingobium sp. SCG-1]AUW57267.1 TonB-dependent receptor [Sphingobium sp. SCG-1]
MRLIDKGAVAHSSFLALSCVGVIISSTAMAAEPASSTADAETTADTAGRIIVNGQRMEADPGPKITAPLINTPRSIVVVDKQVIKDTGSATLVEALRTVPGITFGAAEGGNPIGDRPFIRGFDSQGSTYLDGVRDIGAQSREVFAVEQIQIVRGSDSTLGGRGSAGGSLNIISKLPRPENFAAGSLTIGNANYKRITGDVNYLLSSNIALRVNGMWHDQDVAERDAIFQKRWGIAPSLSIGINGPTKLTLSYYHLDTEELPDSGIAYRYVCSATVCNAPAGTVYSEPAVGTITTLGGQTGKVDRANFYGLKNRDFRDSKTDQATVRFDHDFGNGIRFRNTSRYSHTSQAYILTQPDDSQGNVIGTSVTAVATNPAAQGGYVWRRSNSRFGYTDSMVNQTDLYGTVETGALRHSFAIGAEFSFEKAERGAYILSDTRTTPRCTAQAIARFNCTSLFTPNPNDPWVNYAGDAADAAVTPVTRGGPETRTINNAKTQAIYAFDSISIGEQIVVNLGARYDSFKSKTTLPVFNGARTAVKRDDGIFNWQAGLIFKPTPNTSLYASYATSATPPNSLLGEGQESNGLGTVSATNSPAAVLAAADALRVERTKSYEVGAKADLFEARLSLTAAVFQTETKNARVTSDANTVTFVGERRVKGVELGFNGTVLPGWTVNGGYTYLDAKIVNGGFTALTAAAVGAQAAQTVLVTSLNTGRPFPQTAKHSFTVWSNYEVLKGLSLGGGAFYTSRVFGGYADNRRASQNSAGVVTVTPATSVILRSVPSYWRFDARVGYKINEQLDLTVNVNNLTNKVYFNQAYTSHYAGMAPGRTALATLNFKY